MLIAKCEGNGVVIYQVPSNQRQRKITGWPDTERVTSAIVSEDMVTITFAAGKVRTYNASNGQYVGTY